MTVSSRMSGKERLLRVGADLKIVKPRAALRCVMTTHPQDVCRATTRSCALPPSTIAQTWECLRRSARRGQSTWATPSSSKPSIGRFSELGRRPACGRSKGFGLLFE